MIHFLFCLFGAKSVTLVTTDLPFFFTGTVSGRERERVVHASLTVSTFLLPCIFSSRTRCDLLE